MRGARHNWRAPFDLTPWPPLRATGRGGPLSCISIVVLALDLGAERLELALDVLVAAVDLRHVADDRRALGAQRGEQQRHPGADVRAGDAVALTVELA